VVADSTEFEAGGFPSVVGLTNNGVGTAQIDAYSMVATSPELPEGGPGEQSPTPDIAAIGRQHLPDRRLPGGFIWAFAFDMHERETHAVVPTSYWVDLDTEPGRNAGLRRVHLGPVGDTQPGRRTRRDMGGTLRVVPRRPSGRPAGSSSRSTPPSAATSPSTSAVQQVGMTSDDLLVTNVDAQAYAFDIYFGGPGDATDVFTVTPLGEQYYAVPEDIPGNDSGSVAIYDFGLFPGNTPEEGVLLFTNGDRGAGAHGGATEETEAIHLTPAP
jgi:hypothetical protein